MKRPGLPPGRFTITLCLRPCRAFRVYINNREFLAAIHASKLSFCSYVEPADAAYDAIVHDVAEITPELIQTVRLKKSKPRGKAKIDIETITPESLVFRVMTYEHIPLDPDRVRKSRVTDQSYARTSFPPFKHYRMIDGRPVEVLRSHWKGGIANGHFDPHGGKISDRLAKMFMLLVDRYGQRGNFRNYTYVDDMRGSALVQLSQVGLQFDESKSDNPFAFYTTTIRNSFVRILNVEKKGRSIRDDLLQEAGMAPSSTRQHDNQWDHRRH